jgi:hypothetical protein
MANIGQTSPPLAVTVSVLHGRKMANIWVYFQISVRLLLTNSSNLEKAMTGNDYTALRDRYHDFLSLDELRRVCKICPKSARYLVEHGIIPAIDTGKRTWRYKISIEDVIIYLRKRAEVGSMIPTGAVSNRTKKRTGSRKSFAEIVSPGRESDIAEYFCYIYAGHDEVLSTADVVEMTGLHKSTVWKLLLKGDIKSIESKPKYLIPKKYLLEFVVTRQFLDARTKSKHFLKILGGFEIWKTAKSSQ